MCLPVVKSIMLSFKIIVLIVALSGSVMAIPVELTCCYPDLGVFQYINSHTANCWNETSNATRPLRLACPLFNIFLEETANITVTKSGQLFLISEELHESVEVKREEVCFANDNNANHSRKLVIFCANEERDETNLGYCMAISTVFLILTAVVYATLSELRDLEGKSIANLCLSMGIGMGILAGSKLISYSDMTLCAIRGFSIYFFLMAAFFWTNAISLQLLISLRWKKFSWCALYAWGCPTVLTICLAIVNFHPGDHVRPGIGLNTCWFYNIKQQWYYMYSIMTILITTNICIFIYTSIHIWSLSIRSSHVKALKFKFVMMLRLFIIMGVSWIFEMISSIVEDNIIWAVIDFVNTLQGPITFLLLVVFRKRAIKALLKRGWLPCVAGPLEKCVAVNDDEDGFVEHTIGVTMIERNETHQN